MVEEKPLTCGGGDLPLGGIFVGEQVSLVLASSLRKGGCFESSRFVGTFFRPSAAAPVESVLTGLEEGAAVGLSVLQTRPGGVGSLDVSAALLST
jgi:hypothetical protein